MRRHQEEHLRKKMKVTVRSRYRLDGYNQYRCVLRTLRICLYSTSSKKPDALLNIMIGAMGLYSVEAKNDRTVQQFKRQA